MWQYFVTSLMFVGRKYLLAQSYSQDVDPLVRAECALVFIQSTDDMKREQGYRMLRYDREFSQVMLTLVEEIYRNLGYLRTATLSARLRAANERLSEQALDSETTEEIRKAQI